MRLWHEKLIPLLPREQLLGQHRECCALRGNGWGKKHSTVDYVFTHSAYKLFCYHKLIIKEMKTRGYKPDKLWENPLHRGKTCKPFKELLSTAKTSPIYNEHDEEYLKECIDNLKEKGISIEI